MRSSRHDEIVRSAHWIGAMTMEDIIAREEIRTCILRHFRAADRLDMALERRSFWDDGRFVGGPVDGPASAFVEPLFAMLPASFEKVMHTIANMMIDVSGDTGLVELYGTGWHLLNDTEDALNDVLGTAKVAEIDARPGTRHELWVGVRYAVEMQRRGAEWRILTMQPIIEWTRVQSCAGVIDGGLPAGLPTPALRSPDDASYFGGRFNP